MSVIFECTTRVILTYFKMLISLHHFLHDARLLLFSIIATDEFSAHSHNFNDNAALIPDGDELSILPVIIFERSGTFNVKGLTCGKYLLQIAIL